MTYTRRELLAAAEAVHECAADLLRDGESVAARRVSSAESDLRARAAGAGDAVGEESFAGLPLSVRQDLDDLVTYGPGLERVRRLFTFLADRGRTTPPAPERSAAVERLIEAVRAALKSCVVPGSRSTSSPYSALGAGQVAELDRALAAVDAERKS